MRHDVKMGNGVELARPTASTARGLKNRWVQVAIGILCMGLVANLQYAWTLFVGPIEAKHHWGLSAIQLAFSVFVIVETWLVPVEGWLVDKFGPRPVIAAGAVCAALGWVLDDRDRLGGQVRAGPDAQADHRSRQSAT